MHEESCNIVKSAIGGNAKAVRQQLLRLGYKHISLEYIYRQAAPAQDVLRQNFYERFLRWFEAIWRANERGGELLFADLEARVSAFRLGVVATEKDWRNALAESEKAHAELIRLALSGDEGQLQHALTRYRSQLQKLDATLRVRARATIAA